MHLKIKGAIHERHKNGKSGGLSRAAYLLEFLAHRNINLHVHKWSIEVPSITLLKW